jgi:tRNA G26 N,N-dimethylase Trm1
MNTHTRYPTAAQSQREKRFESAAEISARIAAAQEEAKRIACPHGAQFYKCDSCGNEWAEHQSYPINRRCDLCDEIVEAQDNPLRAAWFAGFRRAQELAE